MKLDLIDFGPSDIAQSNFANHFTLISLNYLRAVKKTVYDAENLLSSNLD